jgi:signal peptidase I
MQVSRFSVVVLVSVLYAQGPVYKVATSAMEPTLPEGEHVLAPGGESIAQLRRGDVIVFHFPLEPDTLLIKRLMGLPGDRLQIVNNVLAINSKAEVEPYVLHSAGPKVSAFFRDFPLHAAGEGSIRQPGLEMLQNNVAAGEVIVPQGRFFVLGDNRDYSYDSRSWGFVAASQIIGRVTEVVSSRRPNRVNIPQNREHPRAEPASPRPFLQTTESGACRATHDAGSHGALQWSRSTPRYRPDEWADLSAQARFFRPRKPPYN